MTFTSAVIEETSCEVRCTVYVCETEISTASLAISGNTWIINNWVTQRSYRRQGYGKQALSLLLQHVAMKKGYIGNLCYIWNEANVYVLQWLVRNFSAVETEFHGVYALDKTLAKEYFHIKEILKMKLAVSYFYHIRFFKPYMIPISTAVWDPKWYHNFKGQEHCFIDKNGVINGLRINPLMPGNGCSDLCRGPDNCATKDPSTCPFLQKYLEQLRNLDFDMFMIQLCKHIDLIYRRMGMDYEPLVVFMVHEAVTNPCSERSAIIQWFTENGCPISELNYPIQENY